ncbi:glycosyltransferase family 2 protein [Mucilaginibacter sp. Bleaf8]|uniref:glycosyltransferase family 2 protein n=1 Tax=Mucilaginibacter sp. Bleaf8 TaxID=2834430 RepID=UPI001BCB4399|nr:glycosyltransferase family A protein [Mucilaginibacter sp. Bleaf8]MBS7563844.1 glycosyltransferase family 2 protein [Mucilaginibacter sp. Bleaf8]
MPVPFSIIIPTYNRATLLRSTLQSLLKQTYEHFEILVIDDGGNDDTRSMVNTLGDSRVKYYWKENAERGAARNYGAAHASGTYLNFFDSDDHAYQNHLQVAAAYLNECPDATVFHTSYDWRNSDLKIIKPSVVRSGMLNNEVFRTNILSINNVFVRKAAFNEIRFSEDRNLSGTEDWFLWLQLCCRYSLTGLADITSSMIQHDTRSMITATGDDTLNRTRALERHLQEDVCLKSNLAVCKSVMAEMYSLTALYYALNKSRRKAVAYFYKAIRLRFGVVYTRRSLAIIKHLFI